MSRYVNDTPPEQWARYAFVRPQDDGRWCVVICEHTDRCPPGGPLEATDFAFLGDEKSALRWLEERIGPTKKLELLQ